MMGQLKTGRRLFIAVACIASYTAGTSVASTTKPSMLYPPPRADTFATESIATLNMPWDQQLLSLAYRPGRLKMDAKFGEPWNAPSLEAPLPRDITATPSSPSGWATVPVRRQWESHRRRFRWRPAFPR